MSAYSGTGDAVGGGYDNLSGDSNDGRLSSYLFSFKGGKGYFFLCGVTKHSDAPRAIFQKRNRNLRHAVSDLLSGPARASFVPTSPVWVWDGRAIALTKCGKKIAFNCAHRTNESTEQVNCLACLSR